MRSHTLNVLSKGLFKMSIVGVITALYIVFWIGAYGDDVKKEFNKPTEQTQQEKQSGK
jgi:hypothetical protein